MPASLSRLLVAVFLLCSAIAGPAFGLTIRSDAGASAAEIQGAVDLFRSDLGNLNPNLAQSFADGRREINWDGVPDGFSAPSDLPADFFNASTPGRARGVVFSTPGSALQVSANTVNPTGTPSEFGNIDPNYPEYFAPFSPTRLFTAIGSNIVDVSFFLPGTLTPAFTSGFGVVFSDVDLEDTTSLQFFGVNGTSLGTFFAPGIPGNETFSFLGVDFDALLVSRVRITSGNQMLAAGNLNGDLVAMDDFIYGEPGTRTVPEPSSTGLVAIAALAFAFLRRQRPRLLSAAR
jgi:hypothetical protein